MLILKLGNDDNISKLNKNKREIENSKNLT